MNRIVTPDEEKLARTVALDRKKQEEQKRAAWIQEQMENCPIITGDGIDLSNPDQQMGRPLTPRQLESRLKKLIPSLHFEINQNNKTKKALYLQKGKEREYICAYENSLMPEHSIMRTMIHEYPDPELFTGRRRLDRNELPAYEKVEDEKAPHGFSYKFDPTAKRPGMKYVNKGFGEEKRGWRTVLLRLVQRGLLSVENAEKAFSADNRAEWAKWTGKQKSAKPTW